MRRARSAASRSCGTAGTYLFASTTLSRKRVETTTLIAQLLPVHLAVLGDVLREVDRAEAAVLVGPQQLLAARIRGGKLVQVRHRVLPVGRVEEQHARFAVVVRVGDDLVEQLARPHRAPHLAIAGVAQLEVAVRLHRLHELVGDANGDVEVADLAFLRLAGDELLDIGVVDPQHGHVGAAAGVMSHHAICQVRMGLIDFQDRGSATRPPVLDTGHFDKPPFGHVARAVWPIPCERSEWRRRPNE